MPAAASGRGNGPNTIRVLVATDNHVGYEEKNPIRMDDAWKTFDEIMTIAQEQGVDMVLLGGDLFHENKPSRKSMYQVIRSLRKHCLGPKPVQLEFLSDANEVFDGAFSRVNYDDPDMNISLPVFSIHGNHDDPSGEGHFSSLDLLQVAGLVNYFGKVPKANDIEVKPVLLQKGDTKLALYGISNVRDERLFRTFRDKHVTFFRPPDDEGKFFNLLAVHQNHTAHTSTSYLPENVLPDWMDLVVWGHEHDCKIEPTLNPETGFHVMQPGSSVATSLGAGESERKHIAIVSITGDEFKSEAIPLKTVRPFVHREISLKNEAAFKKLQFQKDNRQAITLKLIPVVEEMIEEAKAEWLATQDNPSAIPDNERPLPLVRLKVDYNADEGGNFDIENPQRFSNRFVGKVANVNDVVQFYRKKTAAKHVKADVKLPGAIQEAIENEGIIRIDVLVREFLQDSALKVLPQNQFEDAIMAYVDKGDKTTMDSFINESLSKSLKYLANLDDTSVLGDLDGNIERCKEVLQDRWSKSEGKWVQKSKLLPQPPDYDSAVEGPWDDPEKPGRWVEIPQSKSQARRSIGDGDVNMEDGDDGMFVGNISDFDPFADEPVAKPAAKRGAATKGGRGGAAKKAAPPPKPAPRSRRKKGGFIVDSDDEEEEEEEEEAAAQNDAMSLDGFEDDDEEPSAPPKRGSRAAKPAPAKATKATTSRASTSRAAAKPAASKSRQSTLNFSQSQRPTSSRVNQTRQTLTISDDEIDDDDDDDGFEPVVSARGSRR